ncbi:MAG TPA: DUF4032 domain-containing protein [Motilibacteraceae bacterium]|nr:DUF4032 domain-containing protein [Motilibacteraceae bacterium]
MRIVASRPDPALVSLPWDKPLEEWQEYVVPVPRGLSRHVVRVIQLGRNFYAVKEMPEEIAFEEYRLLRELRRLGQPSVTPQAVVAGRPHELPGALVTRHLPFALPYRTVFCGSLKPETLARVVDALVVLLVRLHLVRFYWGDVSLSNVLFRRNAGEFAAYLVDAETGEFRPDLTDQMREWDLEVGCENVFAELLDLEASGEVRGGVEPEQVVDILRQQYHSLWEALTGAEKFSTDEIWRIEQRIERLNQMGFDVDELDIVTEGQAVRIRPRVVEAGHHARELEELTGLRVEDNQARRLLNDLAAFTAYYGLGDVDRHVVAHRWLTEIFEPIAEMIPPDQRGKLEPAEFFHEVLVHRWYLSERAGHEIKIFDVARDYVATQLGEKPEERLPSS